MDLAVCSNDTYLGDIPDLRSSFRWDQNTGFNLRRALIVKWSDASKTKERLICLNEVGWHFHSLCWSTSIQHEICLSFALLLNGRCLPTMEVGDYENTNHFLLKREKSKILRPLRGQTETLRAFYSKRVWRVSTEHPFGDVPSSVASRNQTHFFFATYFFLILIIFFISFHNIYQKNIFQFILYLNLFLLL